MRALVLGGKLRYEPNYADPQPPPGESLVRVTLAGICGTDLELVRGYMGYRGIPGHEFVGRVVASESGGLVGNRVVGEINAGCRQCAWCAEGLGRHCPNRTVLGILGRDGSFADYLCLPDENLYPIPASVTDEAAVFAEPIAAACEIFEQTGIPDNSTIAILGDGRLAAVVALVFKAKGYDPLVIGRHPEKLDRIANFEIRTTLGDSVGDRYEIVVDCTGRSDGFARSLELTAPRGLLVLKSTAAAGAVMNLAPVVINEVRVIGSRCGRMEPALALLRDGKVDPSPLITSSLALPEGLAAFDTASARSSFKVLLHTA